MGSYTLNHHVDRHLMNILSPMTEKILLVKSWRVVLFSTHFREKCGTSASQRGDLSFKSFKRADLPLLLQQNLAWPAELLLLLRTLTEHLPYRLRFGS